MGEKILGDMLKKDYEMLVKEKTGDKTDGLGLLYKRDKYTLLDSLEIELLAGENDPSMNRDTVAQLAVFRGLGGEVLIAANCHLLFNRKRGDIKLWQIQLI